MFSVHSGSFVAWPTRDRSATSQVPWQGSTSPYELFNLCTEIFLLLDCLMTFRTGVLVDGQLEMDPVVIASRYLRGWFLIDMLTSLPVSYIVSALEDNHDGSGLLFVSRLPRILRLAKVRACARGWGGALRDAPYATAVGMATRAERGGATRRA